MGRRSITGGVIPANGRRIQFDFTIDRARYRPTLPWEPTEANLRSAREHLRRIKARIAAGTFNFADEFPDFRGLHNLPLPLRAQTCSEVFDANSSGMKRRGSPRVTWRRRPSPRIASPKSRSCLAPRRRRAPISRRTAFDLGQGGRFAHLEKKDVQQRHQCATARIRVRISGLPREARSRRGP